MEGGEVGERALAFRFEDERGQSGDDMVIESKGVSLSVSDGHLNRDCCYLARIQPWMCCMRRGGKICTECTPFIDQE